MNIRRIGAAALAALLAAGAVAFANSYNNSNGSVTPGVRVEIDGTGTAVGLSKPLPVFIGGASTANMQVVGAAASGATKAGNPVQTGGVYNSTQPTVTTGQAVEQQMTARGASIVATGVDSFNINNVSGTVSLPTGASTAANQTNMQAPVAAATATATKSILLGGQYDSTQKTLTNGQQAALSVSARGALFVATGADGLDLTKLNGTTAATNSGNKDGGTLRVVLATDQPALSNKLLVTPDLPTGAATAAKQPALGTAGSPSSDVITVQGAASGTPLSASPAAATSGGASLYTLVAANTNNSTSVKGSAGQVYSISVYNNSATIGYLKLYDKATAPTCGTDTPVEVHMIPASTSGAGIAVPSTVGAQYTLGIGICVVTGIANNDNTAVAASAYVINIRYK